MNSSKKKNRNHEDSTDEEYVASEFSNLSTSSSNDHGNATVSIGGTQRMREPFRMHFNAEAFVFSMKMWHQAQLQSTRKPQQRQQQRMKRRAQVQLQLMRKPEQLEQQGMKRRAQVQLQPMPKPEQLEQQGIKSHAQVQLQPMPMPKPEQQQHQQGMKRWAHVQL